MRGTDYVDAGLAPIRLYGVLEDGTCQCRNPECAPKNAGKHPVEGAWQRNPIDGPAVDAWLERGGNVGLRMGGGLIALDEDEQGSFAEAESELGALPATLTARTGSGGEHRIFSWPSDRAMPRNTVRWRPGIDVRGQGAQIVAAPSRHRSGGMYVWTDWRAPEPLPEAWVDALLTRAPRSTTAPASSGDVDARALAMAERLPPSIEGHGGDAALFHAAKEIASVLGPDAGAIRRALDVFNARCLPPWPASKLAYEAAGAAAALDSAVERAMRKPRAVTFESASERIAEAADGTAPADGALFLITPKGKDVFAYDPRISAFRECARESLVITLRTSGADAYATMTGPRGGLLAPQAILDGNVTAIVREAVTDFAATAPCVYDAAAERVLLGVVCPTITPAYSEAIDLWLTAMAGSELEAVKQWIASTRQDRIHRLATALCLVGPHSSGKTVFARVCARLWGAEPVELDNVVAQFNANMASCPIVLDDECQCLSRRTVSTEDFRVLLQKTARTYEPKGKERRPLLGAQRFILTANDVSDIRFRNALGAGAVDALAERLTVIVLDDERAELARLALEHTRLPSGELDWTALASHFEHIRQTTAVPDERTRFLGQSADRAAARRAIVAHATEDSSLLLQKLRDVLSTGAPFGGTTPGALHMHGGALWARLSELTGALTAVGGDRWDMHRVREALAPFRTGRERYRNGSDVVRASELNVARVREALGEDD